MASPLSRYIVHLPSLHVAPGKRFGLLQRRKRAPTHARTLHHQRIQTALQTVEKQRPLVNHRFLNELAFHRHTLEIVKTEALLRELPMLLLHK